MENWEQTEIINFRYDSYRMNTSDRLTVKIVFSNQELSQEFQLDNFGECLNRAKIAKIVRLENNNISTLNSILKGMHIFYLGLYSIFDITTARGSGPELGGHRKPCPRTPLSACVRRALAPAVKVMPGSSPNA